MDEAIIGYIRKKHNLLIGEITAEELKIRVGSAMLDEMEDIETEIKGRDLIQGVPKHVTVTASDVFEAISEPTKHIIEAIKVTLEKTPPELASDIVDRGIVLAGGGALLKNLDKLISKATDLDVRIADDPISAVVLGSGKILDTPELLEMIALTS